MENYARFKTQLQNMLRLREDESEILKNECPVMDEKTRRLLSINRKYVETNLMAKIFFVESMLPLLVKRLKASNSTSLPKNVSLKEGFSNEEQADCLTVSLNFGNTKAKKYNLVYVRGKDDNMIEKIASSLNPYVKKSGKGERVLKRER